MNINFRRASITDYEDINRYLCSLNNKHHEHLPEIFDKVDVFYNLEKMKKIIVNDSIYMITLNDKNIGMVQIRYLKNGVAYLYAIYIEGKYRNNGIGKVAIEYAENMLRKNGWDILRLTVWSFNKAIHLYEKMGYVLWDIDTEECTEMYKDLRG